MKKIRTYKSRCFVPKRCFVYQEYHLYIVVLIVEGIALGFTFKNTDGISTE